MPWELHHRFTYPYLLCDFIYYSLLSLIYSFVHQNDCRFIKEKEEITPESRRGSKRGILAAHLKPLRLEFFFPVSLLPWSKYMIKKIYLMMGMRAAQTPDAELQNLKWLPSRKNLLKVTKEVQEGIRYQVNE